MNIVQIATNRYDDALMRVACAQSILSVVQCSLDSQSGTPTEPMLVSALHGIGLLLEDAQTNLTQ